MLMVGNQLDGSLGGEHPFPPEHRWARDPFRAVYESNRRSVYVMQQKRVLRHPFFGTFDGADPIVSTGNRTISTTPLQALYLLNNDFILEQSQHFADRILDARDEDSERIDYAFEVALGRTPDEQETKLTLDHLNTFRNQLDLASISGERIERTAWSHFAQVLISSNEFIYLD